MTRITFGLYRMGVRDSSVTLASFPPGEPPIITPFPMASSAIVRYHREGAASAWRRLDRALAGSAYWGAQGTSAAGWADAIRTCFRTYRSLADVDQRTAFATGLNRDLVIPPHELAVHTDVILLDPRGYVPRIVLWDTNELTNARSRLYAAPAWQVAEEELGAGRVPEVEVWHLRSAATHVVAAHEAQAAVSDVHAIVRRLGA
jgi:hypothetical protein